MSLDELSKAIQHNPDAKAVFVNNPTYYGICSDLKGIVELAHRHNMIVIVDEAHGTHFISAITRRPPPCPRGGYVLGQHA